MNRDRLGRRLTERVALGEVGDRLDLMDDRPALDLTSDLDRPHDHPRST